VNTVHMSKQSGAHEQAIWSSPASRVARKKARSAAVRTAKFPRRGGAPPILQRSVRGVRWRA
jgi:hypothetical protein